MMTSQELKTLFAPGERRDSRPYRNEESIFAFYDRIGPSPLWDEIRALLNEWLNEHPDAENLKKTLMTDFDPRFWELYVHEVFRRLGYHCVVERSGTRNPPDYFCTKGDAELVVECWSSASAGFDKILKLVDGELKYVPYKEKPIRYLEEVLNDGIVSPNLSVSIWDVDANGEQPGAKKICGPVQKWIDGNPSVGDRRRFAAGSWLYTLHAWSQLHSADPFVDAIPMGSTDSTRPAKILLKGIRKKARKEYLQHDEELLIVAASFPSTFLSTEQVEAALYGNGGLWSNGKYRRVDAVLVGKFIKPHSVAASLPTLWLNPDEPDIDLPFETVRLSSAGLVRVDGSITGRELFDLPPEWGTAEPFPDG
jgi:hypothetical protein